jgi:hypothetical protein
VPEGAPPGRAKGRLKKAKAWLLARHPVCVETASTPLCVIWICDTISRIRGESAEDYVRNAKPQNHNKRAKYTSVSWIVEWGWQQVE